MVGIRSFPAKGLFSGALAVSFRECRHHHLLHVFFIHFFFKEASIHNTFFHQDSSTEAGLRFLINICRWLKILEPLPLKRFIFLVGNQCYQRALHFETYFFGPPQNLTPSPKTTNISWQFIATSAEVTPKGSLVGESYPKWP